MADQAVGVLVGEQAWTRRVVRKTLPKIDIRADPTLARFPTRRLLTGDRRLGQGAAAARCIALNVRRVSAAGPRDRIDPLFGARADESLG